MKKRNYRLICPALALFLSLCLLTGCGQSAPEPENTSPVPEEGQTVFIEADGRRIAIEDPGGKTVSDYLEEAGVTLNEGDVLSFDSDQDVTGDMSIRVLRRNSVSVLMVSAEAPQGIEHTAVCYGGTVADAISSVGIELTEDMALNADPDAPLKDNMTIVITVSMSGPEAEEQEEAGEEPEVASSGSSSPSSGSGSSSAGPSEPDDPGPDSSSGSGSSSGERYVVSVEIYEDCDGSGHGVKVYTYSDGSQEEVPY